MKLQGHDFDRPSVEIIVIPRGMDPETGEKVPDVVFKCQAVKDYDEFDALCPVPPAPVVIRAGGVRDENFEDKEYLAAISQRSAKRVAYIFLQSLKATEGLTWDVVKLGDPGTWELYRKELTDSGFSEMEIGRIENGCFAANALNQARVDEALANFLLGQQAQKDATSGPRIGQDSSPSGEAASG